MVFHADKPVPTMDHRGFPWGGGRLWIVGGMEAGQQVTDRVSSWLPEMVTAVATGGPAALPVLTTFPNPARHRVSLAARGGAPLRNVRLIDAAGRVVRRLGAGEEATWDLRDAAGKRVAAGVYWFAADVGEERAARSVTVVP